MKTTFYLVLIYGEHSINTSSFNRLRNSLIEQEKYTDAVDNILVKGNQCKEKEIQNCLYGGLNCD